MTQLHAFILLILGACFVAAGLALWIGPGGLIPVGVVLAGFALLVEEKE